MLVTIITVFGGLFVFVLLVGLFGGEPKSPEYYRKQRSEDLRMHENLKKQRRDRDDEDDDDDWWYDQWEEGWRD